MFKQEKTPKSRIFNITEWNPPLVWDKKVPNTELEKFKKVVEENNNLHFDSYWDFHKWSIENYENFWGEVWNYFDVIASKPYKQVVVKKGDGILDYDWFPGATFNYAENHLRIRDDRVAIIYLDETGYEETVTFAQLFKEVRLYSAAFRKHGLKIGDTVACYMSNRKEAVFAMLATTSIGAIWGGTQSCCGARATANVIKMMDAKFLITIDHYQESGKDVNILGNLPVIVDSCPALEKVIIVTTKEETLANGIPLVQNGCSLEEFLQSGRNADGSVPDIIFEQLPFSHPICINFTSGTEGLPKAPVHSAGTLITFLKSHVFHQNLTSGDIFLNVIPPGWSVWDSYVRCLAMGIKLFLYCGSLYFAIDGLNIWDVMAKYKVKSTVFVPSMVDKLEKCQVVPSSNSNLENFKALFISGSPAKIHNFEYVRNMVKKDIFIGSIFGSTEVFQNVSGFDLNLPYYAGEMQCFGLGMDVRCVDLNGRSVFGERGEIVIGTPSPAFPIYLWKDSNNTIMNATYLSKYPGMWCHKDEGWINPKTKGFIVVGRSDDTLKQNAYRFGAADVYFAIHEMEEIMDYICVNQGKSNGDCRAVLFVKLMSGYKFTSKLKENIAFTIKKELGEICVPQVILEVPDIPYNFNSKRMESLVRKIVVTNQIPEVNNITNPDSLKYFCDIPELMNYDDE